MVIHAHDVLLLVHVVFSTADRRWVLDDDATLGQIMRSVTHRHGGELLGCGNADDHVHLVVRVDPSVPLAQLVQRVKGASSYLWNRRMIRRVHWQAGYWAQSIDHRSLPEILRYVADQRGRHARGEVDASREQSAPTLAIEEKPL
jgi:putative transposase